MFLFEDTACGKPFLGDGARPHRAHAQRGEPRALVTFSRINREQQRVDNRSGESAGAPSSEARPGLVGSSASLWITDPGRSCSAGVPGVHRNEAASAHVEAAAALISAMCASRSLGRLSTASPHKAVVAGLVRSRHDEDKIVRETSAS